MAHRKLDTEELDRLYRHSVTGASNAWRHLGLDPIHVGVDFASGQDYTCYTYARVPGRLRKLLRRIGLDRSKWEIKIIKQRLVKHG